MSFDWSEYLDLARILQQDADRFASKEACLRSATSRAYYAAFHGALKYAESEGFYPKYSGEDHFSVPRHFRVSSSHPNGNKLSTNLHRMLDNRRQADYLLRTKSSPGALADMTIKMAQHLLEDLT